MRDRQRYNFLAALLRQLDQAQDDEDELFADWVAGLREDLGIDDLIGRLDAHDTWLASLDAVLEDGVQSRGAEPGGAAEPDDASDGDTPVGSMGLGVARTERVVNGVAAPVEPPRAARTTNGRGAVAGRGRGKARTPARRGLSRGSRKT